MPSIYDRLRNQAATNAQRSPQTMAENINPAIQAFQNKYGANSLYGRLAGRTAQKATMGAPQAANWGQQVLTGGIKQPGMQWKMPGSPQQPQQPMPSQTRSYSSSFSVGGSPSLTQDPQSKARSDELYNMLMGRAKQGLDVDPNTPALERQTEAYRAEQERARRNMLADIAEREGPNANLRMERRMGAEKVGQATSGFQAELMGREVAARRNEIAQALQSMQGMLTGQQEMELRRQLASMDDQLARSQMAQRESEFGRELGYRYDAPYLNYAFGG